MSKYHITESDFIKKYGHRSLCNCVRRWRGKLFVNRLRKCTCKTVAKKIPVDSDEDLEIRELQILTDRSWFGDVARKHHG